MSDTLHPFADSKSSTIGELTIENDADRVSIYGSADLLRDKAGLAQALELKALVDHICEILTADKSLPDRIAAEPPTRVRNPFKVGLGAIS